MKSSVSVCPVPTEQQPINEYQGLKESWFYSWATSPVVGYVKPILVLWGVGLVIAAPVAAVSFPWSKHPLQLVLSTSAGALVLPSLALMQLYLGWIYVRDRLAKETIFYEESGWYDGQTWTKPEEVLQRDRLVVSYEIQPVMQRLKRTFLVITLLLLGGAIAWNIL